MYRVSLETTPPPPAIPQFEECINPANQYIIDYLAEREEHDRLHGHRRGAVAIQKAIKAISSYPEPIIDGAFAKQTLLGVGPYIASLIDRAVYQERLRQLDEEEQRMERQQHHQSTENMQPVFLDLTEDDRPFPSSTSPPHTLNDDVIMLKSESKDKLSNYNSNNDTHNDVSEWLDGIKYSQYLSNFLEAGYDELRHILILTDKDLNEIKIKPPGHRKMLLIEAQKLAAALGSALEVSPSVVPPSVEAWLQQIGYISYLPLFIDAGYDEIRHVVNLEESDFEYMEGIKPGHKRVLLHEAQKLSKLASSTPGAPSAPISPRPAVPLASPLLQPQSLSPAVQALPLSHAQPQLVLQSATPQRQSIPATPATPLSAPAVTPSLKPPPLSVMVAQPPQSPQPSYRSPQPSPRPPQPLSLPSIAQEALGSTLVSPKKEPQPPTSVVPPSPLPQVPQQAVTTPSPMTPSTKAPSLPVSALPPSTPAPTRGVVSPQYARVLIGSTEARGLGGSGAVAADRRQNPAKLVLPEFIRYHIEAETEHKGIAYYLAGAVVSKEDSPDGQSSTCQVLGTGSNIYVVDLHFDNQKITSSACTCPARRKYTGWCKHIMAALAAVIYGSAEPPAHILAREGAKLAIESLPRSFVARVNVFKGKSVPTTPSRKRKHPPPTADPATPRPEGDSPAKKKRQREYIPTWRSGPFAIMIALYLGHSADEHKLMTRSEIVNNGREYTDTDWDPTPGFHKDTRKWYSAWNGMKQLIRKGLVQQTDKDYYSLTPQGLKLAQSLYESHENFFRSSASSSFPTANPAAPSTPARPLVHSASAPTLLSPSPPTQPPSTPTSAEELLRQRRLQYYDRASSYTALPSSPPSSPVKPAPPSTVSTPVRTESSAPTAPSIASIAAPPQGGSPMGTSPSKEPGPSGRGAYKCGLCGQPKKGHICPISALPGIADTSNLPSSFDRLPLPSSTTKAKTPPEEVKSEPHSPVSGAEIFSLFPPRKQLFDSDSEDEETEDDLRTLLVPHLLGNAVTPEERERQDLELAIKASLGEVVPPSIVPAPVVREVHQEKLADEDAVLRLALERSRQETVNMTSLLSKEKQEELREAMELEEAIRLSQQEASNLSSSEVMAFSSEFKEGGEGGIEDTIMDEQGSGREGGKEMVDKRQADSQPMPEEVVKESLAETEDTEDTSASQEGGLDSEERCSDTSVGYPPSYSQVTPECSHSSPFSPFKATDEGLPQRSTSPSYSPPPYATPTTPTTPTTTPTTTTTTTTISTSATAILSPATPKTKRTRKRTRREREKMMTNPYVITKLLERGGRPAMAVLGTEFQADWEILLLVDSNEPSEMKKRLRERFRGFYPIDFRRLIVGDYVWIAWKKKEHTRWTNPSGGESSQFSILYDSLREGESQSEEGLGFSSQMSAETQVYGDEGSEEELYVLDWVLERKEILDLAEALGEKRLDRQFRSLSRLGLNTIWLVEGDNSAHDYLTDELYNKTILEGFLAEIEKTQGGTPYPGSVDNSSSNNNTALFFQQTWKKEDTVEFLLEFTNQVRERCRTEGFVSMLNLREYNAFKPEETVKTVFVRMLKEVKGCTKRKAKAIARLYPSPMKLVEAYDDVTDVDEKERLLENLTVDLSDEEEEEEEGGEGKEGGGEKEKEREGSVLSREENAGGEDKEKGRQKERTKKKKRKTKVGKAVSKAVFHLITATTYDV